MTDPKTDSAIVVIICALCVTVLMSIALKAGMNGKIFALSVCILGGLGGLKIKDIADMFRGK